MKTLAICLLISVLAGCVTIQSNTKPEAIPTFKRILVVTKMRKAPDSYAQSFTNAFPAGYQVCTVALSPLSFDKPDEMIRKQAEACQSEVILTLELSKTGHSDRYHGSNYEYNAEMTSVATGQSFWKAIISSNPNLGEQLPPRSVVKRLLNDHIIDDKRADSQVSQALN